MLTSTLRHSTFLTALLAQFVCIQAQGSDQQVSGKQLYESRCQICHGPTGLGDGQAIPETMVRPRAFNLNAFKFDTNADWQKGTDTDLFNVIRKGPAAYGGSSFMPAWGTQLSDDEITTLVAYVRKLSDKPIAEE